MLRRLLLAALAEGVVVSLVVHQLLVVDVHGVRAHVVEERHVVGHHDERLGRAGGGGGAQGMPTSGLGPADTAVLKEQSRGGDECRPFFAVLAFFSAFFFNANSPKNMHFFASEKKFPAHPMKPPRGKMATKNKGHVLAKMGRFWEKDMVSCALDHRPATQNIKKKKFFFLTGCFTFEPRTGRWPARTSSLLWMNAVIGCHKKLRFADLTLSTRSETSGLACGIGLIQLQTTRLLTLGFLKRPHQPHHKRKFLLRPHC